MMAGNRGFLSFVMVLREFLQEEGGAARAPLPLSAMG